MYTLIMLNYGPYVWVSGAYIAAGISFLFAYCYLCSFGLFTWRSERFIECTAEFALNQFVTICQMGMKNSTLFQKKSDVML